MDIEIVKGAGELDVESVGRATKFSHFNYIHD